MADRAYLVCGDTPATPGTVPDGGINYDPDREILAGSSVILPLCWLA